MPLGDIRPTYSDDFYRFDFPDHDVTLTLERFVAEKRALHCEITVRGTRADGRVVEVLPASSLNLMAAVTRTQISKKLAERHQPEGLDWEALMEAVCSRALKRWREGEPLLDMLQPGPLEQRRFLLSPFIDWHGPTVIYADGGTGKSTLALAVALTVATGIPFLGLLPADTGKVLYLDYEADLDTHTERLLALCQGLDEPFFPPEGQLLYRRETAPLSDTAVTLRQTVAREGIRFIVIDSLGLARMGEPESAEATIRLFGAIRRLGVPPLCIDHIAKNAHDPDKPFGSVYTHNSARLTWKMERTPQDEEGKDHILLTHTKGNYVRGQGRREYEMTYEGDDDGLAVLRYTPVAVGSAPTFANRKPVADQVADLLQGGPLGVKAIQEQLGGRQSEAYLRVLLDRHSARFVRLGARGAFTWGLRTLTADTNLS